MKQLRVKESRSENRKTLEVDSKCYVAVTGRAQDREKARSTNQTRDTKAAAASEVRSNNNKHSCNLPHTININFNGAVNVAHGYQNNQNYPNLK